MTLGGFAFQSGDPPSKGGLVVMTRRIGAFLYPVLIGAADDMAAEADKLRANDPALASGLADGMFWMTRPNARQRDHVLRDLVGKYDPPLNVDYRKGRAAPEIAALVPDRAVDLLLDEAAPGAEPIEVGETELREMVRAFYGQAMDDPLIGPVFAGAVSDWEHHPGRSGFLVAQSARNHALLRQSLYAASVAQIEA